MNRDVLTFEVASERAVARTRAFEHGHAESVAMRPMVSRLIE